MTTLPHVPSSAGAALRPSAAPGPGAAGPRGPRGAGTRARAAIAVSRGPDGRTRYDLLRGDGPIAPRVTAEGVYLVGQAAGPLGGDDLELACDVGPGATLTLRSVAASLLLPGPYGGTSRLTITATVAAGGALDLALEPTIAAAGCDHHALTRITLADGATLRLREEIVLGRHGERPGRYTGRLDVTYADRPLLRHELALGDDALTTSPAILATARALGLHLNAGPGAPEPGSPAPGSPAPGSPAPGSPTSGSPTPELRTPGSPALNAVAVTPLAGPGTLTVAVAPDAATLRRRLTTAAPTKSREGIS